VLEQSARRKAALTAAIGEAAASPEVRRGAFARAEHGRRLPGLRAVGRRRSLSRGVCVLARSLRRDRHAARPLRLRVSSSRRRQRDRDTKHGARRRARRRARNGARGCLAPPSRSRGGGGGRTRRRVRRARRGARSRGRLEPPFLPGNARISRPWADAPRRSTAP
jgi:hypothetical protein